ncbi:MAG: hypothetical protein DSZ03_04910 [Sulfurimonas sp.]|nr:MAG: hypothetical protein DSZ03_04910 [Sulfurimonas sp.]
MIVLVLAYHGVIAYIDANMPTRLQERPAYDDCHKIWAARGLYKTREEQNSIIAMQRAFGLGAHGAEVDFHYDIAMNRFIISHDHPKKSADGTYMYPKKGEGLLTLETFLAVLGPGHFFWLDFKNLDKLSREQTRVAIARLLAITDFDTIRERLYIEGSNPLLLSMYTDAGFRTILGIHPLPGSNPLSSIVINGYKIAYYFKNITALAMPYGKRIDDPIYDAAAHTNLKGIPVFVFHTPDDEPTLRRLMAIQEVRVVLVGKDLSINRYAVNACKE